MTTWQVIYFRIRSLISSLDNRTRFKGLFSDLRLEIAELKKRYLDLSLWLNVRRADTMADFIKRIYREFKSDRISKREKDFSRIPAALPLFSERLIDFERRLIENILTEMGFLSQESREIVRQRDNFTNLNIPVNHPAREEHGSFNLVKPRGYMLRSQLTSSHFSEGLYLNERERIFLIGRVYRDDKDSTHLNIFHQVEWLIKKNIGLNNFLVLIKRFLHLYMGDNRIIIRPSFFPFTYMSFEIDLMIDGDVYEVAGAGIMNPLVLSRVFSDGHDRRWPAMAFGLERIIMIKYGFKDINRCYDLVNNIDASPV